MVMNMNIGTSTRLPELINHFFWNQKEHFQLDQDTYLTWILFAVEKGHFTYRIAQTEGQAKAGDIVICPPHIGFHRKIENSLSFHAISFDFPDQEMGFLREKLQQKKGKLNLPLTSRVSENYKQLRTPPNIYNYLSDLHQWKQHYFHDLWFMLAHHNPNVFGGIASSAHVTLKQILNYLEQHAHQSVEMKRVAAYFQFTPVQMIRDFKKVYHMTPLQYLTSIRVKKAAKLLLETDWNLDAIANECGYENGYYLSRLFHKHMGLRPSEYRKTNRF